MSQLQPEPYTGPPATGWPPPHSAAAQPGYPPGGFPPGYPGAGYAWGSPAPFAGHAIDPADVRPGPATAAAVLGFVGSGLLILAGGLLLVGASLVADIESASGSHTNYGIEIGLDGVADLIAAALLIAGGVLLTGRKPAGRVVLTVGNAIVAALTIYWLVRFGGLTSGLLFYPLLFAALAVVSTVLAWLVPVSAWLNRAVADQRRASA
ncbi:hypothetical protein [Jatrophihabitans endophyticus]|uniref:hypothetical protein n=1 Tax=Jatrophihabitans endophyticus TaxID=1206085 RepID=UPI0019F9CE9B|nr:hypothetical protein [Jatrophihabitans endophyticus]MBE7188997.1 hypothetical protein [Jatrophihabitans endophyticus]